MKSKMPVNLSLSCPPQYIPQIREMIRQFLDEKKLPKDAYTIHIKQPKGLTHEELRYGVGDIVKINSLGKVTHGEIVKIYTGTSKFRRGGVGFLIQVTDQLHPLSGRRFTYGIDSIICFERTIATP